MIFAESWHITNPGVWYLIVAVVLCAIVVTVGFFLEWRDSSPDRDETITTYELSWKCWLTNRHIWDGRACARPDCNSWKNSKAVLDRKAQPWHRR